MSRYDTHLERMRKQIRQLRQKRISGKVGDALREYGVDRTLPKDSGLREWVLRFTLVAEAMKETLPKRSYGEHPHPTKENRFPKKIMRRGAKQ
jgi:hypothetical protein